MSSARIHPDVILDGRLAIFHERARWLALADVHYGYSQVMRDAGGLFPLWGNCRIEERLQALCRDYRPDTLVICGDLVHGRVRRDLFAAFLDVLRSLAPRLILIAGNHDRSPTVQAAPFLKYWDDECGFFFHHGHLDLEVPTNRIEITGHWHPALRINDGAGLRLKLPSLVAEINAAGRDRWILPAFSPWAGGTHWEPSPEAGTRRWVCSPQRVFEAPL